MYQYSRYNLVDLITWLTLHGILDNGVVEIVHISCLWDTVLEELEEVVCYSILCRKVVRRSQWMHHQLLHTFPHVVPVHTIPGHNIYMDSKWIGTNIFFSKEIEWLNKIATFRSMHDRNSFWMNYEINIKNDRKKYSNLIPKCLCFLYCWAQLQINKKSKFWDVCGEIGWQGNR